MGINVDEILNEQTRRNVMAKLGLNPDGRKPVKKRNQIESKHQVEFVRYVRTLQGRYPCLRLLYAIPNGGRRNQFDGARLKAEGALAGVSDLCLPVAAHGYHGLYIEMKAPEKGQLSKAQKLFIEGLIEQGYCVAVPKGAAEATTALDWYIGTSNVRPPCVRGK